LTLCLGRYTLAGKMSVIERIKQIQAENEQKAAKAEAARVAAAITAEQIKRDGLATQEARRNLVKSQAEKIMKESGVGQMLLQLEKDLLQKTSQNHRIFEEFREDGACYRLAWNYKPSQIVNACISGYDYNSVLIYIDPDTESVKIGCTELEKKQWQEDKELVEKTLAEAFLYPYKNPKPGPHWGSSDWGGPYN